MRKKIAVALPLTAAALIIGTAGPALALSGDYLASGVSIRKCPHTTSSCTVYGLGYPGQGADVSCYTTGTSVDGNPYWVKNKNETTDISGYSAAYYVEWSGAAPAC